MVWGRPHVRVVILKLKVNVMVADKVKTAKYYETLSAEDFPELVLARVLE